MAIFNKTTLLALLLVPGAALAQINIGDTLGTNETTIRSAVEAQGYYLRALEVEGDEIEIDVDAKEGGTSLEVEISSASGAVTSIEIEDMDDGEDTSDKEGQDADDDVGEDTNETDDAND